MSSLRIWDSSMSLCSVCAVCSLKPLAMLLMDASDDVPGVCCSVCCSMCCSVCCRVLQCVLPCMLQHVLQCVLQCLFQCVCVFRAARIPLSVLSIEASDYGVATISRPLKIISLFCRIQSLW